MTEGRDRAHTGLLIQGAGGALAAAPFAANRAKRGVVVRRMDRASGTLGGLTGLKEPVDPLTLGVRGGKLPGGGRRPSAREAARGRYTDARVPYLRQLARPAVGRRGKVGAALAGASLAAYGIGRTASGARERLHKSVEDFDLSPQLGLGIPASRTNPISPLAMYASSGIMANFLIGASGRRLSRAEKKAVRRGAYGFAGAQGMLFSPMGYGRSNST